MTRLLAILEFGDFAVIAFIVIVFAGGAAFTARQGVYLGCLQRELNALQRKMDALLKHHGIEPPPAPPSGLSSEVERLASSPKTKFAAIKLYREQNPGVGLAEARAKIEAFAQGRTPNGEG